MLGVIWMGHSIRKWYRYAAWVLNDSEVKMDTGSRIGIVVEIRNSLDPTNGLMVSHESSNIPHVRWRRLFSRGCQWLWHNDAMALYVPGWSSPEGGMKDISSVLHKIQIGPSLTKLRAEWRTGKSSIVKVIVVVDVLKHNSQISMDRQFHAMRRRAKFLQAVWMSLAISKEEISCKRVREKKVDGLWGLGPCWSCSGHICSRSVSFAYWHIDLETMVHATGWQW